MDKYVLDRVIGRGASGDAVLATRNHDGLVCVIKRLPLLGIGSKEAEAFENEVQLLSQLHHPSVVDSVDSFVHDDGESNTYLCIVMRYCDGGDLGSFLKANHTEETSTPEDQIFFHFVQLALALEYIHSENILHRDLKSMNVFMHKGMMKIGDFGVAKLLDPEAPFAQTCIGTPYYMSPEVFMGKPYNHKSDVWALGCLLYELTMLKQPFHTDSLNDLASKIMKGSYAPISPQYSNSLRSLIKQMLALSADDRPAVKDILQVDMLQGVLRSVLKAMLSGKEEEYSNQVLENLRAQIKRLGLNNLLELVDSKLPSSKQQSLRNAELKKKCKAQESQLQKEEAAERELENIVAKLRFGYDERGVQIDHRTAMLRERKQNGSFNSERKQDALLADSDKAERRKDIRMRKEMLSDNRQRREEELKKFERIQEKHTQTRKERLDRETYFEDKERKLTDKNRRDGGSAQAFSLECKRILTTIDRESEELKHLQDERKWLEKRLGQMDLKLGQSQLTNSNLVDVKTKKTSPINARRTTRLPSAFGGPRLAYREGRRTMALPSTITSSSKREDKERDKSKTTANLPQSPSRGARFEESNNHLSPRRRSKGETNNPNPNPKNKKKNAKSRVLAAKEKKRKEEEREQKKALSAARKEYDLERQKANKRTQDFMHSSGFIPDEVTLPDFGGTQTTVDSPLAAAPDLAGNFNCNPARGESLEDSGDDSLEELQVLEEEHYQDEWELGQLQAAVERRRGSLQRLRHSLLMNKRVLVQAGPSSSSKPRRRRSDDRNKKFDFVDGPSPQKGLPVIIKTKEGRSRRKHRSTDQKIRDLTKQCTALFGKEVFVKAKTFLQDANNNSDPDNNSNGKQLLDSLVEIIGKDKIVHWTLLDNLIYLETKKRKKERR